MNHEIWYDKLADRNLEACRLAQFEDESYFLQDIVLYAVLRHALHDFKICDRKRTLSYNLIFMSIFCTPILWDDAHPLSITTRSCAFPP